MLIKVENKLVAVLDDMLVVMYDLLRDHKEQSINCRHLLEKEQ